LPPEPTSLGKTYSDVLRLFMMILLSSGISLVFLWYVAKNAGLFSRLLYFNYRMTALEEEYPSWWPDPQGPSPHASAHHRYLSFASSFCVT